MQLTSTFTEARAKIKLSLKKKSQTSLRQRLKGLFGQGQKDQTKVPSRKEHLSIGPVLVKARAENQNSCLVNIGLKKSATFGALVADHTLAKMQVSVVCLERDSLEQKVCYLCIPPASGCTIDNRDHF